MIVIAQTPTLTRNAVSVAAQCADQVLSNLLGGNCRDGDDTLRPGPSERTLVQVMTTAGAVIALPFADRTPREHRAGQVDPQCRLGRARVTADQCLAGEDADAEHHPRQGPRPGQASAGPDPVRTRP